MQLLDDRSPINSREERNKKRTQLQRGTQRLFSVTYLFGEANPNPNPGWVRVRVKVRIRVTVRVRVRV